MCALPLHIAYLVSCGTVLPKFNERKNMLPGVEYIQLGTLLQCPRLVGGQIEVQEHEKIYRGPIKRVGLYGPNVHFDLEWCGYYDIATDKWTAADQLVTVILKKMGLKIACRRDFLRYIVTSEIGEFIVATVDVQGGYCLNPEDVIDLDLNNLPKPEVVQLH